MGKSSLFFPPSVVKYFVCKTTKHKKISTFSLFCIDTDEQEEPPFFFFFPSKTFQSAQISNNIITENIALMKAQTFFT